MQGNSSDVSDPLRQTPAVPSQLAIQVGPFRFQFRSEPGGMRPFVVPVNLRRHPLVADHFFYAIPQKLLELVVQRLGDERFDREVLELERRLSALVGDYTVNVGIRREGPISYELLSPCRPLTIRYDDVKNLGWGKTEAEIHQIGRIGNERLQALSEPIRGYCGWLMTNREFVEEHDQLLRRYLDEVRQHDFPKQILGTCGKPLPESKSDESWVAPFRDFYSRWRLQGLAGPGLPRPLPPMVPSFPAVAKNLAPAEGGATIFLPDTVPVATRGILLKALGDAVHGQRPPTHLLEWHRIIRRQNPAKNAINRYGRLFSLQHYWRHLHARHPAAVRRNTGRLRTAFAEFYDVSEDSIRKDLTFIARRLGRGWERRTNPLA